MKILLILTGLGMGGAERQVLDLAEKFKNRGEDVSIIFLTGEATATNIPNNINIVKIDFKKNPLKSFLQLRDFINQQNPDVVHSHMIHANIIVRLVRLVTKIKKLICTAHSKNEGGKLWMLAYRLTDFLADLTTNVSQEAVDEYIKLRATPKNKIKCLYNGIDTEKFKPNLHYRSIHRKSLGLLNKTVFLAVGRLVKAKDYPNLLNAFQIFLDKKDAEKYHLIIAGDGPEKKKMEAIINDLSLRENVTLLGMRSDINELMNAADFFILSSAWEGFGLVVAEAMATEKITIATDAGGVSEVLGDYGFLVPNKDSYTLSSAMEKVCALNTSEKTSIEKKSRKHIVNNFSLQKITAQWLKIYRS